MNTETITLHVTTFHIPPPEHAPADWSSCLCGDCWREYLEECDRQDDLSNPCT
jgi:hypothetical protein